MLRDQLLNTYSAAPLSTLGCQTLQHFARILNHKMKTIMTVQESVCFCIALAVLVNYSQAEKVIKRLKRGGLIFPEVSGMGIFLAIAIPVDLPQYELSMSYNFEGNYLLPGNASELEYGPTVAQARSARSLTRTRVYNVLEERLAREGLVGRECLLRTICETSATPIEGHNGLLGDLIHMFFTPSSSEAENLPSEFQDAEDIGKQHGKDGCLTTYSDCPIDLYEIFSVWEQT